LQCGAGFGDALDAGFAGLIRQPILVAAVTPVGEVGFGDGLVIKFFGEKFFGVGEPIEPLQEVRALLAVLEAAVEIVADGFGELGDFSDSGFHGEYFLRELHELTRIRGGGNKRGDAKAQRPQREREGTAG